MTSILVQGPALRAVPIAPCLHEVAEAAFVPLREQVVCILTFLDDWLILVQSQDQLCEQGFGGNSIPRQSADLETFRTCTGRPVLRP